MRTHAIRSLGNRIAVCVVAALLLAPAALAATGRAGFDIGFINATEHRQPFSAPPVSSGALATGGWERDLERQLADAFPLRTRLIAAYDAVKYGWLDDSTSRNVIRGRNGWLFLGAEERDYVDGAFHPSDAALAAVADVYAGHARWCRRHGIRYLFVLAPNKSTIYPEQLGSGIRFVTPTAADRFVPMLRARGVETVDPRAALREAARAHDVYAHGDTHWNDAGAYLAYSGIAAALRDAGVRRAVAPSALRARIEPGPGDLYAFSGFPPSVTEPWLRYSYTQRARETEHSAEPPVPGQTFVRLVTAIDDATLPSAVVFGDSFAEALRPFLAESFRRAVFLRYLDVRTQFDPDLVARERPAVVVQELVERNLTFGALFER